VFLCVFDSLIRLCVFFCFVCFVGLMDMSSMEEDQVVRDATQVVGNSGASSSIMVLHDILRNIEQMLTPFKRYIEASEVDMAQALFMGEVLPMAQSPPMAQALYVVQTTHANVPIDNIKEPKFIMPEKFDGTQLKYRCFVQQVNLFLRRHPSRYPDDSMQLALIGSLFSRNALSWFVPFLEKHSPVLQDMAQFEVLFTTAFGDSGRERVAETKMQSLRQGTQSAAIYTTKFKQLTCDLEWNDKAFINRLRYGLKDDVKDQLITMPKVETL
jgi:hypothetical protein